VIRPTPREFDHYEEKWAELESRLRQQAARRLQQRKPCRGMQALRAEYEAMFGAGSAGPTLESSGAAPAPSAAAAVPADSSARSSAEEAASGSADQQAWTPPAAIDAELQRMAIEAGRPGWDGAGSEGTKLVDGTYLFRMLAAMSQCFSVGEVTAAASAAIHATHVLLVCWHGCAGAVMPLAQLGSGSPSCPAGGSPALEPRSRMLVASTAHHLQAST